MTVPFRWIGWSSWKCRRRHWSKTKSWRRRRQKSFVYSVTNKAGRFPNNIKKAWFNDSLFTTSCIQLEKKHFYLEWSTMKQSRKRNTEKKEVGKFRYVHSSKRHVNCANNITRAEYLPGSIILVVVGTESGRFVVLCMVMALCLTWIDQKSILALPFC